MAEFAAAASGAGIASLGVQYCRGLATYYSSYKDYDEQIGAIEEQIEMLTSLFEQLGRSLSRLSVNTVEASSVHEIESILGRCQRKLQALNVHLRKCQAVPVPQISSAKLANLKSRVLYPFREKSLLTLRENVQNLQGELQLSLQILQM